MFAFVMLKESGIGWEFAVAPLASNQRIFTLLVLKSAGLVSVSASGKLLSRVYTLKYKVLRTRSGGTMSLISRLSRERGFVEEPRARLTVQA
jgi:hypothetical protein